MVNANNQKKNRLSEVIRLIEKDTIQSNRKALKTLLTHFGCKYPQKEFETYFLRPEVIKSLVFSIYTNRNLYHKGYRDLQEKIYTDFAPSLNKSWFRIRRMGNGRYPNTDFIKARASYICKKDYPVLITRNYHGPEEKALWGGAAHENYLMSRLEVKILASLLIARNAPQLQFGLENEYRSFLDIDEGVVKSIPKKILIDFLLEYESICIGSSKNSVFEFVGFYSKSQNQSSSFYHKFNISDNLLLRTAFHLLKANMLWPNVNFYEESVTNCFCAIEGSMLMMQREAGISYTDRDRVFLKRKFKSIYGSDDMFEFVYDEVFGRGEKRAQLLHVEPITAVSWVPFLSAEDWRDYYDISKQLMYFLKTNQLLQDYNE